MLRRCLFVWIAWAIAIPVCAKTPVVQFNRGDTLVIMGNSLAERMNYFGHFETYLQARFADKDLTIRNVGWSGDELSIRMRSRAYKDHGANWDAYKPDVVIGFWGLNESFRGKAGLAGFKQNLAKYIKEITSRKFEGNAAATKLVLIGPAPHEDITRVKPRYPGKEFVAKRNELIAAYTEAMREVAAAHKVAFVDIYNSVKDRVADTKVLHTINGIHLTDEGHKQLGDFLDLAMFGEREKGRPVDFKALTAAVKEKCWQHYMDYRAVNGYYIYGGRKKPFGVVNFPAEFAKLRKMIAVRDQRIWAIAQGRKVPSEIDDSETGRFVDIKTNFKRKITITSPTEAIKKFDVAKGFAVNLFASEADFPELENPCQLAFDKKGRLWVCTMASYPMYLPGKKPNDKILILEDTNGDGKADKKTVFADGLHIPTGIELGHGGVYVAQQPNLVFLKDTDGDDKADVREVVLMGFDSADSHHSISAFTWGPGGALYFQEGTFHQTQIETPYGVVRCSDAGVFRYEPQTGKVDVFVSYRFANPWGHTFDRWGQNFVADASGGANYFGTAFSGSVDWPNKHRGLKQFFRKQWRPTSGCELVSSRNFPKNWQGDYLLNNCIGFQGVLRYKVKDDKSGFRGTPAAWLIKSSDPSFRPVDLELGGDGALYIVDWFNPLVGHMQHSLRDPNRDKSHGRIWRIRYTGNAAVKAPNVAGASIAELLKMLSEYEDRTRYRVRRELGARPTKAVLAAVDGWTKTLDAKDDKQVHLLLEALWIKQHHDIVDEKLLGTLLRAKNFRARAAATRVLCYWRDQVKKPLDLLRKQVNDEHPRVRLEAVRALSFFKGKLAKPARDIAFEAAIYDQDDYIKYTLRETLDALDRRAKK